MDFPEIPPGKSPRRELQLQGPRPTPLKVRKDSHKIRKPPVAPSQQPQPPPGPPRPPVIIYTVSPKVIHANPSEFMTLVQRLTGPNSTTTHSSSSFQPPPPAVFQDTYGGAISPAARLASIEKIKSPEGKKTAVCDVGLVEGIEINATGHFPGILSPNPASLPPIPATFFSPPSDPNPLGFFYDLSPVLHSSKNYMEGSSFVGSPSSFISPRISPTTPSLDLFNNMFDF